MTVPEQPLSDTDKVAPDRKNKRNDWFAPNGTKIGSTGPDGTFTSSSNEDNGNIKRVGKVFPESKVVYTGKTSR